MCSIDTATPWREHAHTCVIMCCVLAFDWSAHRLRAAEAKAKANKVRLWKGYTAVERAAPVSANAKFSGVVRVSACIVICMGICLSFCQAGMSIAVLVTHSHIHE